MLTLEKIHKIPLEYFTRVKCFYYQAALLVRFDSKVRIRIIACVESIREYAYLPFTVTFKC